MHAPYKICDLLAKWLTGTNLRRAGADQGRPHPNIAGIVIERTRRERGLQRYRGNPESTASKAAVTAASQQSGKYGFEGRSHGSIVVTGMLGGRIEAASDAGSGATFTLLLPAAAAAPGEQ